MALDKETEAVVVRTGFKTELVIFEQGQKDWNKSINATLVDKAYAEVTVDRKQAPDSILEWFEWQAEAKEE